MIHNIQNPAQALDILHEVANWDANVISWWEPSNITHFTTVFDLDESLEPNDIPTRLSKCETCDLTVDFTTDQNPVIKCPRCHEDALKVIASAELVIQGSVVLWRES